jgi:thiol-disulfide isomerase/thioredoxin
MDYAAAYDEKSIRYRRSSMWSRLMMSIASVRPSILTAIVAFAGLAATQPQTLAQSPDPDPAALKAFSEMVQAWRDMPALGVKTTVKIEMLQGDAAASSDEITGEFVFGKNRHAVIKLRGFTCYLSKDEGAEFGAFAAVHEKDSNNYFTTIDDGSPYYALLNSFIDMPFPELAIMLGEDAIEDVVVQFHPKAPWLQPTAVETVQKDGVDLQHITMTSDFTRFDMYLDPKTKLIQSAELDIAGGDLVRDGATLVYKYEYEYEPHEEPLDPATFRLDPAQRQKVDLMAALLPAPAAREDVEGEDAPARGALVGKPAPPVTLATADGKAFDLADMHGRVVVLDFWASWCPPCMAGLPKVHEVAKWAIDEQLPVTVMTVNVWEIRHPNPDSPDARLESARKTWEKKGFTLPIAMDYSDQTAAAYGVQGIPTTVIIRSDGIVHAQHVGAADAETLKSDIQAALKAVEPGM